MVIRKAFRYRLRPNRKTALMLFQFSGACRWVYNRGLNQRNKNWEKEKKSISLYEQNKELSSLKKEDETSWLKSVHSQILQQSLGDLDQAFKHFFRRVKQGDVPGHPRFRCKGDNDSFRYPQGVKVNEDQVFLPKIGWVRFRKSREISGEIKQTTVIQEGGKWYVSFSCEQVKELSPLSETPSIIGIDVGLENFAIVASEHGIEETGNPRYLREELKHLRFLSRQLSKKKKGSQNRRKAKARLQSFHARIRNKRRNFLHKLSTKLVKSHDVVAVETLKVKSLLENSPKRLARAISDAGWRQFLQFLKYKCEHFGKKLVEADRWFPSTKQCYQCKKRNEIALNERQYNCSCGFSIHRDHNAALNLRAVGTTVLKACGAAPIRGSNEAGILCL
jgi:putative transposase